MAGDLRGEKGEERKTGAGFVLSHMAVLEGGKSGKVVPMVSRVT